MKFIMPTLPYGMDALAPHISKETLEYHYGKHHKSYVDKLNVELEHNGSYKDLEDVICRAKGSLFNNAAQVWNHTFYWHCMSPNGGGDPAGLLKGDLIKAFGSVDQFKQKFTREAIALFGSGWAWLAQKEDETLEIFTTKDADNPLVHGKKPLLTCDVWEHAYYIDYRNSRENYLKAFWNVVNWDHLESARMMKI